MNPFSSKVHFLAQTRQTKRRTNRTEQVEQKINTNERQVSRMRRRFSALSVHPRSWASSGSPVYNFRLRCPCKECISGSFRIEVLPVRLRLLPFRTTVFNLWNNLFYDDFIWSWHQTTIWSLKSWIVIPTFGFHGNDRCEFRRLKFKILSKTFFKF